MANISGIGLLTATALYASANGAKHYRDGRHLASWLGLTPREHSSGNIRRLGGISKRGDRYVRMLLTHGARAVLLRAGQMQRAGQSLNALQRWELCAQRANEPEQGNVRISQQARAHRVLSNAVKA